MPGLQFLAGAGAPPTHRLNYDSDWTSETSGLVGDISDFRLATLLEGRVSMARKEDEDRILWKGVFIIYIPITLFSTHTFAHTLNYGIPQLSAVEYSPFV